MTRSLRSLLLVILAAGTLLMPGQDSGQISLIRAGGSETHGTPASTDMSGAWTGTILTQARSIPLYLVLHQDTRSLIGTIGRDAEHQNGWPVSVINGALRFRPDPVSEVSLTLKDGRLVGEITRLMSDKRANVPLPDETAGFDHIVQVLLSAYDHTDILALGESHTRKLDSDLRIRLIRHPEFAKKVHSIVVEFGNKSHQSILDRYVQGEDVPVADLQQVFMNTAGLILNPGRGWDSPVYTEFFAAVRDINQKLPAGKRVRVFAGDPPAGSDEGRNISAASILKKEVLDKRGKALLIYGSGHLDRYSGIMHELQSTHPGRMFVVDMLGGPDPKYQKFEDALKSSRRPVLVSLRRAPFRDFSAAEFLIPGLLTLSVLVPASTLILDGVQSLGQRIDACVYLGMSPDVNTRVNPPPRPQLPFVDPLPDR